MARYFKSGAYFNLGNPPGASLQFTGDLTIMAWVKPYVMRPANDGGIVARYNGSVGNNAYAISQRNNHIRFYTENVGGSGAGLDGIANLEVGKWSLAFGIKDSVNNTIAVSDGKARVTIAQAFNISNVGALNIGRLAQDNSFNFNGEMGPIAIWNAALLPAEEFLLLMGVDPRTIRKSKLQAYWPMDPTFSTGDLIDVSGNQNNVVQTNSIPYTPERTKPKAARERWLLSTLDDSATVTLSLTPSAVEVVGIGSFGTEDLKLTPSGVDVLYSDVGTEILALTPSVADIQDIHDVGTENFKFTVSGVEAPQFDIIEAAVEYIKLVPAGVDIQAKQYTDSALENFRFTITSHDCFAIATPSYDIEIFKRWNMGTPFKRWDILTLGKRWNAYLVETGFEIPC